MDLISFNLKHDMVGYNWSEFIKFRAPLKITSDIGDWEYLFENWNTLEWEPELPPGPNPIPDPRITLCFVIKIKSYLNVVFIYNVIDNTIYDVYIREWSTKYIQNDINGIKISIKDSDDVVEILGELWDKINWRKELDDFATVIRLRFPFTEPEEEDVYKWDSIVIQDNHEKTEMIGRDYKIENYFASIRDLHDGIYSSRITIVGSKNRYKFRVKSGVDKYSSREEIKAYVQKFIIFDN